MLINKKLHNANNIVNMAKLYTNLLTNAYYKDPNAY